MNRQTKIHPSLRIELDFKGNIEFLISWSLVQLGKETSVEINFAHAGNSYVKNAEGKDCKFDLNKYVNEKGNKISKFSITEFKTRTGQQASFALKYNIQDVLGRDGAIYEYSIPINGLPFAKKEQNGLEALLFDLPNTLFHTSSLLPVYPFPDNIIEINERTRLIYEKDKIED